MCFFAIRISASISFAPLLDVGVPSAASTLDLLFTSYAGASNRQLAWMLPLQQSPAFTRELDSGVPSLPIKRYPAFASTNCFTKYTPQRHKRA